MKDYEVISAHFNEIAEAMVEHYRTVIESDGGIQYQLYIWDDGELESLEQVQGDHSYLVPNEMETRDLYYVTTIDAPCFCTWDFTDEPCPDDAADRERMEKEIVDWLVSEYKNTVDDTLDAIIDQLKLESMYA